MPLLSGNVSCTRFNVISMPEELNFEQQAFQLLNPGSSIKERAGFVPFELDEPYEMGHKKWAFRVRKDKITVDSTLMKERFKELVKIEHEQVAPPSPKKKRELRQLAEDELLARTAPRSKIIECLLEHGVLLVGSISKEHTDTVFELMRRIGVEMEYKTPWAELGQELESPLVDASDPGKSVLGCHFLKKLLEDPTVFVEPEKGRIKLITAEGTNVTLTGSVLGEMTRYLEEGAEILSAKLIINETGVSFDGLSYQLVGMKIGKVEGDHWTEVLLERVDPVNAMWELLDEKYIQVMNPDNESEVADEMP